MSTSNKTLAFFGATGDCAGYCLANALHAGYTCSAFARTPSKLTASLKAKSVPSSTLDSNLTIVQGDARDLAAVKRALVHNNKVVDVIVSGVGGTPHLQWSLYKPVVLGDPTICQDACATVLRAAKEVTQEAGLPAESKPYMINVSTTGIPSPGAPWDVPLLFTWLYKWVLQDPHADKEALEEKMRETMQLPDNERGISAYVNIKPSLLMDGQGKGLDNVRHGIDEQPAIGYTTTRQDVGAFMFERIIRSGLGPEWKNKSVSVTN